MRSCAAIAHALALALAVGPGLGVLAGSGPAAADPAPAPAGAPTTIDQVKLAQDELPAGWSFTDGIHCTTPAARAFYEAPDQKGLLPKPVATAAQSVLRKDGKPGTFLFLQYAEPVPRVALTMLAGLLWDKDGAPSAAHPEEILTFDRFLVLVCFDLDSPEGKWFKERLQRKFPGAGDESAVRAFGVPNHGALEFRVPNTWKDSLRQPPGNRPPTIVFEPMSGKAFKVLCAIVCSHMGGPGFTAPDKVKERVEAEGNKLADTSVEGKAVLEEVKGEQGAGWVFTFTDKNPQPGDFKCMTMGELVVGELVIHVTLFFNEKGSPAWTQVMDVLKAAHHKPGK